MRPDRHPTAVVHQGAFDLPAYSIDRPQRLVWLMKALGGRNAELRISSRAASLEELARAHDPAYVEGLRALSESGFEARIDPELIVGPKSYEAAASAAGALLDEARRLITSNRWDQVVVCLSRPGSHHAGADYGLGFCLINNIAVAAAGVIAEDLAERVAILDFDAHHGNGTEEIFNNESRVLTISMHQYPFFPGTGAAGSEEAICNLNLPLEAGSGDQEAREAWQRAVERITGFEPNLIIVEAGLDGHRADWTTGLDLTSESFLNFGHGLRQLGQELAVPVLLEAGGGYTEEAVLDGMDALLRGLGS